MPEITTSETKTYAAGTILTRACQFRVNGTKQQGIIEVAAAGFGEAALLREATKTAKRRSGDPKPEFVRFMGA
jgi:hypothetical protein